jgi:hypothetical protein
MRLTVHLLGGLRHYHGGVETIEIEIEPSTTVNDLFARFHLPPGEVMQVLSGGVRLEKDAPIGERCEVEIFPILAGG